MVRKRVSTSICGLDFKLLPKRGCCTSKRSIEQPEDVHRRNWMAYCRCSSENAFVIHCSLVMQASSDLGNANNGASTASEQNLQAGLFFFFSLMPTD